MTTIALASPVDFEAYGDYAPGPGAYRPTASGGKALVYPFEGRIRDDGSSDRPATPGRYHLYVSHYCPWAQRPLIALKLRGLEDVITWSAVDPVRDGRGWAFREGPDHGADPVNGFSLLRDAYLATDPTFDGHVSVPALWDRETHTLASNHYPTLTADLETEFRAHADPSIDLYPEHLRAEIDAINAEITRDLAGASFAALSARTQADYDTVADRVFGALDRFDARLATQRYLVGGQLTDADLLLYVNLVRFDVIAVPLARLSRRRIVDYPSLWPYARDLYQRPAFRQTTNFDHIREGTFRTRPATNPHRIVPAAPEADWEAPHDRAVLA